MSIGRSHKRESGNLYKTTIYFRRSSEITKAFLRETEKTAEDYELYEQCVTALNQLYAGRQEDFSNGTAKAFRYIYDYVTEKCKNLGYYDSAMAVYDGSALWK